MNTKQIRLTTKSFLDYAKEVLTEEGYEKFKLIYKDVPDLLFEDAMENLDKIMIEQEEINISNLDKLSKTKIGNNPL